MLKLKNIKVHLGLSEETYAYTATVYFDGKKAVEVSNQGHGGGDFQHEVNKGDLDKVANWIKNNIDPWISPYDASSNEADLEYWCGNQVTAHLTLRDMKRAMKAKVLFTKPDAKGVFELKFKGVRKYDPRMATICREQYPDAVVLNELPEAEALAIYSA